MYVADYGECFPMADCWSGSLLPYMPGAHALDCPRSTYGYGFAYNRDLNALGVDDARGLNGHLWGDLRAPGELVALYDSSLHGPNRSGLGEDLPDPPRHPDGNHFAFADGHAGASRGEPRFQVEWKPNPPAAPNAR
jgi:prepilin-type processing-associated H-X9-DG protein